MLLEPVCQKLDNHIPLVELRIVVIDNQHLIGGSAVHDPVKKSSYLGILKGLPVNILDIVVDELLPLFAGIPLLFLVHVRDGPILVTED